MELALDVLGMEAQVLTGSGGGGGEPATPGRGRGRADYPVSEIQASFFFSRSETIWAARRRSSATSSASGPWPA